MEYIVIRSARKTLCLSFDREGNIVVRAPKSVSADVIAAFVERHRSWIEKHRGMRQAKISLADGAEISLCGKSYPIRTGRTRLTQDALYLPAEERGKALLSLCSRLTGARMREMTERIAANYGFSYTKIRITSARKRWGSCSSKGHISYSLYGAFLTDELAEYLAVHELCHTRHLDHSAAFWKEVKNILPDYAKRREELKKYQYVFQI